MKKLLTVLFLVITVFGMDIMSQPVVYTRCKSPGTPIPDNNPVGITDTFNVDGLTGSSRVITNVYVNLQSLPHTWVGDLIIKLTKGTTIVFICARPGLGAIGSQGNDFTNTRFADTSRYSIDSITNLGTGSPIPQFNMPFTGSFKTNLNITDTPPVMDSLSRFRGLDPQGTWTLSVSDNAAQDLGTLASYCLTIEYLDITSVGQVGSEVPTKFYLNQNYPNPFNPTTNIQFGIPVSGNVKLVVTDILGREVTAVLNEYKSAGTYNVGLDMSQMASGVYFYTITTGNFVETKKLLLTK